MIVINLTPKQIYELDLSPVKSAIAPLIANQEINKAEQKIQFQIEFPRDDNDPRELSEIPEIRLWFVRLDSVYPWMPFFLDWQSGELARYAAMLLPHEFSRREGIQFNPEALELFVMSKVFVLADWLQQQGVSRPALLKSMAQLFGYELADNFFELI